MTSVKKRDAKLYSYKNDELRNKIPDEHLFVSDSEGQREQCKKYFEDSVELWNKYYEKEGNPYKHNLPLIKSILKKHMGKKLLDLGCGTGVPLLEFLKMGFDAKGCDFVNSAVKVTGDNLTKNGYDRNLAFKMDIEDKNTLPHERFDVIVAIGVFPHIINDELALQNIRSLLNDDGIVLIQFRNDLFNLFTFNAYSKSFFKRLIDFDTLPDSFKKVAEEFYNKTLATEGINSEFGILSKFHNPLVITNELFKPSGFKVQDIHFFHFHRLPPILQLHDNKLFRQLGDEMEKPNDWRGHFMASSFVVEAIKK